MAQSLEANLSQINEQMPSAYIEAASQKNAAFNEAANGAIQIMDEMTVGTHALKSFFAQFDPTARRDLTDSGDYTQELPTATDVYDIKLFRKNRLNMSISALKNKGIDPNQITAGMLADNLVQYERLRAFNSALYALVGCTTKQASTYLTKTALSAAYSISSTYIMDLEALLGDSTGHKLLVLHSTPRTTLKKEFVGTIPTNTLLASGMGKVLFDELLTNALGVPVLVTDSAALTYAVSSTVTGYRTLLLTEGAASIKANVTLENEVWIDRAKVNAAICMDGEYDELLAIKGFSYNDYANKNPTDATLATTSKWTLAAGSVKHGPGCVLLTK